MAETRTVLDDPCLLCGKPVAIADALAVEMNRHGGQFVAHQNHTEAGHGGATIHAERVSGVAHRACYAKWYEETYQSPFIMSGDG